MVINSLRRWLLPFADPEVLSWSAAARWLQRLTFLWLGVGLVVLFSASLPMSLADHGDGFYYIKRQLAWAILGVLGYSAVLRLPLKWWWRMAGPGLLVCTVLMGLTLSHGTEVNEASRWLALGPLLVQPSELVKPFLILQSSRLFGNWFHVSPMARLCWLGVFALVVGMILLQPNLSMAGLTGMTLWVLALVAGLPWFYLGTTAVTGVLLAGISLMLKDYQRQRVVSFLNPWADPWGMDINWCRVYWRWGRGACGARGWACPNRNGFSCPSSTRILSSQSLLRNSG